MTLQLYSAKQYIKHWQMAKGRHSLHSPFLYNLYDRCLHKQAKHPSDNSIENIRKQVLQNNTIIPINDLGAGSHVTNQAKRSIRSIAKYSLKSQKEAKFIACLAQKINAKSIVELGTSLGITTAYLALYNSNSAITTIEGSPEIARLASSNFKQLKINNINLITSNFDDVLTQVVKDTKPDILFIDGNHTYEACLRYFNTVKPLLAKDSFIVFDDIYWSKEMTEAWKEIISDSKVQLSIDLFHLGIISFSSNYSKQHFTLKW